MKTPTKFVTVLSEEEINKLIENHQTNQNFRIRNRSHAILLSHQATPINEIAKICRVDRDTVSVWIDLWHELKFEGLEDEARSGRPKTLTPEEEEKALEIALRNPRFPARQQSAIAAAIGKQISTFSLKGLIKKKTTFGKELS